MAATVPSSLSKPSSGPSVSSDSELELETGFPDFDPFCSGLFPDSGNKICQRFTLNMDQFIARNIGYWPIQKL